MDNTLHRLTLVAMYVEYNTNNSGGRWWLTDEHWLALERAGCRNGELARGAVREGLTLEEAIAEFESVTGLNASDPGCRCCGRPHNFTAYDRNGKYVGSGPDVVYEDEDEDED